MKLKSTKYIVARKYNTTAQGWSRCVPGDILQFSIELEKTNTKSGGANHPTHVTIENLTQGYSWKKTQTQLLSQLELGIVVIEELE